jgi:hypothetical protein
LNCIVCFKKTPKSWCPTFGMQFTFAGATQL